MKRYVIRIKNTKVQGIFKDTLKEAFELINFLERIDKKNGIYKKDTYEIYDRQFNIIVGG